MDLNEDFWDHRYRNNEIGWDLGQISPPFKDYIDQLTNKSIRILIPGGGNSYEAEYLFNKGFKNVFVVDLSKTALDNFLTRVPDFPKQQLIHNNFFDLEMTFDLILEQTFFCAIEPRLRNEYVAKMYVLLSNKGKLAGLLFNAILFSDRPPFGGFKSDYIKCFENYFNIVLIEKAYNSHTSRMDKELFFIMKKANK